MRRLPWTVVFLLSIISACAQNPLPIGKGQLNTGFGVSSWGMPIYLGFDYGLARDFTFGGEFSFRTFRDNYQGIGYGHTIVGRAANLNYHLNRFLKLHNTWDFYAGVNAGQYSWSSSEDYIGTHHSGFGFGAQLGARYYFAKKTGLNLEFSAGNVFSGGKIGLTFKL